MTFKFFKTREAIAAKIRKNQERKLIEIQNEKARIDLENKINNLDRFIGSLEEYNCFKGETYEIMDTGRPNKFVNDHYDSSREKLVILIKIGCCGLIRYIPYSRNTYGSSGGYGLPIKKK